MPATRMTAPTTPTLTPTAGRLHRVAALITSENLPDVHIAFGTDLVVVGAHGDDREAENTVRRWSAALRTPVTTRVCDMPDGTAGTEWSASAWDGHGSWWLISGRRAVQP